MKPPIRILAAAVLGAALALGTASGALAAEAAGIKFDERIKLGNSDLVLNGVGVRTRIVVNVYAAGLYLAEKKTSAADAIAAPGPKRVTMTMLRDLTAQQLSDALNDGLKANTPEPELARFKPQVDELTATMTGIKEAKRGDVIAIDFLPDAGTQVMVNGKPQGKPIAGADFYRALLRVWLGDKPVDGGLKRGLLGQG